ncbi:MAG: hypothetical protein CM1200mP41_30450 [Gammaproteobacteria bacterium]|nr:MAG: hypothetical protein CM1200mP41_30450 [Gammaproteobacteria bacterium]
MPSIPTSRHQTQALPTDFSHFDMDRHLSTLVPAKLWLRHTIGMADALDDTDLIGRTVPDDRLPVSLEQVIPCINPATLRSN